jgi:hypothetical protein
MKPITCTTPRRSFIKKSFGILSLAVLPQIDSFGKSYTKRLAYHTIGLSQLHTQKISQVILSQKSFKITANKYLSDILFLGNKDNLNFIELQKAINSHALIIAEKPENPAQVESLKNFCMGQKVHLVLVEKWNEQNSDKQLFDKISFVETVIDEVKIHQSISYLNLLNSLTTPGGFTIV